MTSINAGGAFYRVQNEMANNSDRLSQSMQRLASGKQNIAPGDRTASTAVAFAMKAESASLKVGMMNGTEALQSIEMVTNDLSQLNDIVVRLEEIHSLGTNAFVTTQDRSALTAEANNLLAEMTRISGDAKWKGNSIIKSSPTDTTTNTMSFGRNTATIDIVLDQFKIPEVALGFNTSTDAIYLQIDKSGSAGSGTAYTSTADAAKAIGAYTGTGAGLGAVSALAVDGAVFHEHLIEANQTKGVTAVPAAVSAISAGAVTNLTIGGSAASGGVATADNAKQVTILSAANDAGITFTIVGTDQEGNSLTEKNLTGGGIGGTATSTNYFKTVESITASAATAGAVTAGFGNKEITGPVALAGSDIGSGSAEAALALLDLKTVVDNMNINAGTLFNKVSNTMSHMGSLNAGYQLDLASKMDVDFAGETAELAKGQILAQAGTAMLAQANAQRQGMLALLQS